MSRLQLLVETFQLSCSELANASGRKISKSQVNRIIRGLHRPSPKEKASVALGLQAVLRSRMDSAYLFDSEEAQS